VDPRLPRDRPALSPGLRRAPRTLGDPRRTEPERRDTHDRDRPAEGADASFVRSIFNDLEPAVIQACTVVRLPPIPPGRRHAVRLDLDGLEGVVRIDPKNAVAEADETNNQARVRGCRRIGGR
jgi:hypothetical protein